MAHEQDENSRREFLVKAGLISAAVVAGGSAMIAQSGSAGAATQSTPGQMMLTNFPAT